MKTLRTAVLAAVLVMPAAGAFAQPPPPKPAPPSSAQEGFVPIDAPATPQDTMPAPRMVGIAYAAVWVILFGYLWSVKRRLTKVEREMDVLNRRVQGSGGRA
jgi:CcmD family protein